MSWQSKSSPVGNDVKDYIVIINEGLREKSFDTEQEAWDYIGEQSFGSRHFVTDRSGNCRSEFVPF